MTASPQACPLTPSDASCGCKAVPSDIKEHSLMIPVPGRKEPGVHLNQGVANQIINGPATLPSSRNWNVMTISYGMHSQRNDSRPE